MGVPNFACMMDVPETRGREVRLVARLLEASLATDGLVAELNVDICRFRARIRPRQDGASRRSGCGPLVLSLSATTLIASVLLARLGSWLVDAKSPGKRSGVRGVLLRALEGRRMRLRETTV
jgi:hypothetical protein